jgi:hypothetical protein
MAPSRTPDNVQMACIQYGGVLVPREKVGQLLGCEVRVCGNVYPSTDKKPSGRDYQVGESEA